MTSVAFRDAASSLGGVDLGLGLEPAGTDRAASTKAVSSSLLQGNWLIVAPQCSVSVVSKHRRKPGHGRRTKLISLELRWIVEAANSWLSNLGQLHRNTDRRTHHRHAALCLATTILVTMKLIAWRDRYLVN